MLSKKDVIVATVWDYLLSKGLSAVIDYVVWEDGAKTQLLLDNLCVRTLNILEGAK